MDLTDAAVENLVTQFSSALDFFRELVQNSMDAGSDSVDVWMEYLPGEGGGTIAMHVDDFGEGMNEEIIDDQLTRLFSSSKEDDLTKIGKFGIGFVSVFALQPEAVLVHTGRGGEYWEILFHADRSFTKSRVDTPVEGTQITLFVRGDRTRYRELVLESRKTLAHWCGHSEVEVTFEDRSSSTGAASGFESGFESGLHAGGRVINQPFVVEGECPTSTTAEETQIVLAYAREPKHGFYNKGLALAVVEGESNLVPPRFRHIAFKIKSRYLEHTLSRETVMRDQNYDKAMAMLASAADGPLFESLVTRLRQTVEATRAWGLSEIEDYLGLIGFVAAEPFDAVATREAVPMLRTVDGGALSMAQVWSAAESDGRVFVSDAATPLTERLRAQGIPVLLGRGRAADGTTERVGAVVTLLRSYAQHRLTAGVLGFLRAQFSAAEVNERAREMVVDPEQVFMAIDLEVDASQADRALIAGAHQVLEEALVTEVEERVRPFGQAAVERESGIELGYRRMVPCRVSSAVEDPPLFVVGRELGPLMAVPPPGALAVDRGARPEAAVNIAHPQFRGLLALYEVHPKLAVYCLAKDLLLAEDRMLDRDAHLMLAAGGMPGSTALEVQP